MHVCMHVCIEPSRNAFNETNRCECKCVCMQVCMYGVYVYVCTMYACRYVCMYVCKHAHNLQPARQTFILQPYLDERFFLLFGSFDIEDVLASLSLSLASSASTLSDLP